MKVLHIIPILLTSFLPAIVRAQDVADPAKPLLDEATTLLLDLRKNDTFMKYDRAGALFVQLAALQAQSRQRDGLYYAREIPNPYYASLALGIIAAQNVHTDPALAEQLLIGAQERALSISGYTGTDATSLQYLFELTPLFDPPAQKRLLAASRRTLTQWVGDGQQKSRPMLELARQTVALNPDSADALLDQATAEPYASPHLYESVQFLARNKSRTRPDWAAEQVAAFYGSRKPLPGTYQVLFTLIMEDALRDLPGALGKIGQMPVEDQDQARFYVVLALRDAKRLQESAAIIDFLKARISSNAPGSRWIAGVLPPVLERWTADEKLEREAPASVVLDAGRIDAFIAKPDVDELRLNITGKPLHFRDRKQATAFLATAGGLAPKVTDFLGYPHHGSPRSVFLGTLAQLAARLGDLDRAHALAKEITIPELRAFYLMDACAAVHPLPAGTRDWPIYFYSHVIVRIGE